MRAVLDAAGVERAALVGVSEGGPMSALFAATYPERIQSLVLYGSFAKGSPSADYFPNSTGEYFQLNGRVDEMLDHWGEGRAVAIFAPSLANSPTMVSAYALFERASACPSRTRT